MIATHTFRLFAAIAASAVASALLQGVASLADPSHGAQQLARQQAPATPTPATQSPDGAQRETATLPQAERVTAMESHR